jgi:hypothetical protein
MKSTAPSTGEVIDFGTRERMAPPAEHNNPPLESQIQVDWGYHARAKISGNPHMMQRAGFKPVQMDRDLLLYTLWTSNLRMGREIAPLTSALAATIMCEHRATAARRITRLEAMGLVVKVSEGGSHKTEVKVPYSQAEMDAIIASALTAYNASRDTIPSQPTPRHKQDSVATNTATQIPTHPNTYLQNTPSEPFVSRQNHLASRSEPFVSRYSPQHVKVKVKGRPGRPPDISSDDGGEVAEKPSSQTPAEMFGPALYPSAERLAGFLGCDAEAAITTMMGRAVTVSPGVVLNAVGKLDLSGRHKGKPIKNRLSWFNLQVDYAAKDAGAWIDAPKPAERRPEPATKNGQIVNSEGLTVSELFARARETEAVT